MKTKMGKTRCSICGTEESSLWLSRGIGTYCKDCSKDINDFNFQPHKQFNAEILAEVFFRRGKGEETSYEKLHKTHSNLNFISIMDLLKQEEKSAPKLQG